MENFKTKITGFNLLIKKTDIYISVIQIHDEPANQVFQWKWIFLKSVIMEFQPLNSHPLNTQILSIVINIHVCMHYLTVIVDHKQYVMFIRVLLWGIYIYIYTSEGSRSFPTMQCQLITNTNGQDDSNLVNTYQYNSHVIF